MKFELKDWTNGKIALTIEGENWKLAFSAAIKAGIEFRWIDLSDMDFSNLTIKGGLLYQCKFNLGTTFYGTTFDGTTFDGTTFDGTKFYGTTFDGTTFDGTKFYGTTFDGTKFYGTTFDGTTFDGTKFYGTTFDGTTFDGTKFYGTTFDGTTFDGTKFYGTTFDGTTFQKSTFNGKKIVDCERPIFVIHPLGADQHTLIAINTDKGIHLQTGCFDGSVEEFNAALKKKHGKNDIAQEYTAAIKLVELHFKLWAKK